jgi:hypothetical protein
VRRDPHGALGIATETAAAISSPSAMVSAPIGAPAMVRAVLGRRELRRCGFIEPGDPGFEPDSEPDGELGRNGGKLQFFEF